MGRTVFDVIIMDIDKQIEATKEFVSTGSPKDYAAYRETVGLLRGLGHSRQIVEDLQRNNMKEDDDD